MINDDSGTGTGAHSVFTIKFRSALLISAWDRYCLKWSSAYNKQHAKAALRKFTFRHQYPTVCKLFVFLRTHRKFLWTFGKISVGLIIKHNFSKCLSTLSSVLHWSGKNESIPAVKASASDERVPNSNTDESTWDLLWTNWQWGRFSSK